MGASGLSPGTKDKTPPNVVVLPWRNGNVGMRKYVSHVRWLKTKPSGISVGKKKKKKKKKTSR
jgi:hypothetical protein